MDAEFAAIDCYAEPISKALKPARLAQPVDVVTLQFCMHYAFENLPKTRMMLENVTKHLRRGGVFIGTIPNADQLMARLRDVPEDAEELTFGNSVYKIRFQERTANLLFGRRYWFYLQDAVEDVPEYVVYWSNFESLASEYGLKLVYKREFHDVFMDERESPEFGPLLQRMKVMDASGGSKMTEDEWEAANLYLAFAFEKQ